MTTQKGKTSVRKAVATVEMLATEMKKGYLFKWNKRQRNWRTFNLVHIPTDGDCKSLVGKNLVFYNGCKQLVVNQDEKLLVNPDSIQQEESSVSEGILWEDRSEAYDPTATYEHICLDCNHVQQKTMVHDGICSHCSMNSVIYYYNNLKRIDKKMGTGAWSDKSKDCHHSNTLA